jgi:hypothetical protein
VGRGQNEELVNDGAAADFSVVHVLDQHLQTIEESNHYICFLNGLEIMFLINTYKHSQRKQIRDFHFSDKIKPIEIANLQLEVQC